MHDEVDAEVTTSPADTAQRVADRVRECPGVVGLSTGPFGTLVTPVVGGTIPGVLLREDSVELGVVARYGPPLPATATELRRAVRPLVPGREVHVSFVDLVVESPAGNGPDSREG
ncbi:hypothetical protein RIF23_16835 [Lipingzhangella sp. LS1_29]|uniref:Asp23/Gls24 family envelope stress response protein n=1 Tax=Lipingzhangella rawalii TaxID=2055835 RepID=A0ABU2H9G4_9ACTN|nr:hypothetical protein [Lipingzhangella rawalii]MDS1271960.1 hypothetical protein [Lipingzhangella rawalii]